MAVRLLGREIISSRGLGAAARDVGRFTRNPVRYSRGNYAGAGVLLFIALVTIAYARRGTAPTPDEFMRLAGAALVVVITANIAPEFMTWLLLATVIVVVMGNVGTVSAYVDRGFSLVRQSLGGLA